MVALVDVNENNLGAAGDLATGCRRGERDELMNAAEQLAPKTGVSAAGRAFAVGEVDQSIGRFVGW